MIRRTLGAAGGAVVAAIGSVLCCAGVGHWLLHREEVNACTPGKPCADPRVRRRVRWTLWIATVVAAVLVTFSFWIPLFV